MQSISQIMMKPLTFFEQFKQLDSGYNSLQVSPETEFPPNHSNLIEHDSNILDWNALSKELDNLLLTSTPFIPIPKVLKPKLMNYIKNDCTFIIEGIIQHEKDLDYKPLDIKIHGPSGQLYSFEIKVQYYNIYCTFHPIEVGLHVVTILFNMINIFGSPLQINISRDYSENLRPIITMDIEISTDYLVKPSVIQIRKPWGIACNIRTEQILVTDREHHEIFVFKPDGDFDFTFGRLGSGPSEFFRPTSIVYDYINNRIIVGDKDNHRVQIFNDKGKYLFSFGTKGFRMGQFLYPWGIAVSKCGQMIVVADTRNHRIQLFTLNGIFLRQFPIRQNKAEFNHPRGITFDLNGKYIYVSDFNLNCIFKIDINFKTCIKIIPDTILRRPQGLVIDEAGNLLVTDSRHNCIKVFLPCGQFLHQINKFGSSVLDLPLDLTVLRAGYIAILDLNGRVNII